MGSTPQQFLAPEEMQSERIANLTRVFAQADTTIAGRDVHTRLVAPENQSAAMAEAPAWNDGETIFFRQVHLGDIGDINNLIALNGLNYHELAHILYTPRFNHSLYTLVNPAWMPIWNILEDQRIETLLTNRYYATRPYLRTIFLKHILSKPNAEFDTMHILSWGRLFLPRDIRQSLAAKFVRQDLLQDSMNIIDEYRMLNVAAYPQRAARLVELMVELLQKLDDQPQANCGSESQPIRGTADQSAQVQKDVDKAKQEADEDATETLGSRKKDDQDDESQDGQDADDDEDGDGEGEGDTSDGDSDQDAATDDSSSGDGSTGGNQDGDQDDDGEPDPSDNRSKHLGQAGGNGVSGDDSDFDMDMLRDIIEDVVENDRTDSEVVSDMKRVRNSINTVQKSKVPEQKLRTYSKRGQGSKPEAQDVLLARKMAQEFQTLIADKDPGFRTHQPSGRVSIKRAMQGVDYDTAFDVWEEGQQDASDIEAVILVDLSASMRQQIHRVSRALWTIKRSLDMVSGDTRSTVLGFSSESYVIYSGAEKISPSSYNDLYVMASTSPGPALTEARRIFGLSKKKHKVMIVLSDGVWDNDYEYAQKENEGFPGPDFGGHRTSNDLQIEIMKQAGVTVGVLHLGRVEKHGMAAWEHTIKHFAHVFGNIQEPSEMIPFTRALIKGVIVNS